jgi:hypothetical protein
MYMQKLLVAIIMLSITSAAVADDWTQELSVVKLEPLVSWQGGAVRIVVDATVTTSLCGNGIVLDFMFTGGTQESRSATLSALYMAFAADKRVKFYVSSTSCSPVGTPMITGLDVIR